MLVDGWMTQVARTTAQSWLGGGARIQSFDANTETMGYTTITATCGGNFNTVNWGTDGNILTGTIITTPSYGTGGYRYNHFGTDSFGEHEW